MIEIKSLMKILKAWLTHSWQYVTHFPHCVSLCISNKALQLLHKYILYMACADAVPMHASTGICNETDFGRNYMYG